METPLSKTSGAFRAPAAPSLMNRTSGGDSMTAIRGGVRKPSSGCSGEPPSDEPCRGQSPTIRMGVRKRIGGPSDRNDPAGGEEAMPSERLSWRSNASSAAASVTSGVKATSPQRGDRGLGKRRSPKSNRKTTCETGS